MNKLKYIIRDQVQDDLKASLKQSFDPHIGGPWMEHLIIKQLNMTIGDVSMRTQ